ncbi:MAG: TonB-dependent receptor [Gammaproteobacteria bacterium]
MSAVGDGLYTLAFAAPGGSGTVPVFYRSGGNPDLGPESSRNLNLGFDYAPPALPGLRLGVSAYQVHFRNRIIEAPYDPAALQHPEVYGSLLTPVRRRCRGECISCELSGSGGKFTDYLGKASPAFAMSTTLC